MQAQYDAFAQNFSDTRNRSWPEFELLEPLLKKGDRLLDLGCGNGRLRQFVGKDTIIRGNYFGLDISQDLLDIARTKHASDHFFKGDMKEKFPFGDDNFEVITAIASFHHLLQKKDQHQCLQECFRVLKPGGIIFMTTWKLPQKYFWPNILRGNFKNWNIPFGPERHPRTYRNVKPREIKRLLKQAGFKTSACNYFQDRNLVVIAKKP